MAPVDYFDIFRGVNNQYYWNLHNGGNHAIIATGGEGFISLRNAHESILGFVDTVQHAFVPDAVDTPSMAQDDLLADVETPDPTNRFDDGDGEDADVD